MLIKLLRVIDERDDNGGDDDDDDSLDNGDDDDDVVAVVLVVVLVDFYRLKFIPFKGGCSFPSFSFSILFGKFTCF